MILEFITKSLVTIFVAAAVTCAPNPQSKNYKHSKSAKTEKVSKHKKATKSSTPIPQSTPVSPVSPAQSNNQVNIDWVERYDELLSKHGAKLNPPKKPGDRNGITVQGTHDIISPKVQKDFETLNALDKQKQ